MSGLEEVCMDRRFVSKGLMRELRWKEKTGIFYSLVLRDQTLCIIGKQSYKLILTLAAGTLYGAKRTDQQYASAVYL